MLFFRELCVLGENMTGSKCASVNILTSIMSGIVPSPILRTRHKTASASFVNGLCTDSVRIRRRIALKYWLLWRESALKLLKYWQGPESVRQVPRLTCFWKLPIKSFQKLPIAPNSFQWLSKDSNFFQKLPIASKHNHCNATIVYHQYHQHDHHWYHHNVKNVDVYL